jgi:hypothetical protein
MLNNSIALVILNKNDADSLKLVLSEFSPNIFDYVIGLDGDSTDHSLEVFAQNAIPCIQGIPGGRGGAIKYAINNLNYDYLIFLSSDGEENPAELPTIIAELKNGSDLVIASRMLNSKSGFKSDHNILYLHRKLFLLFISYSIKVLFGNNIKDCWNGYRGINTKKAFTLGLDADNFLLEAQMTIRFLKHNFIVKEIPTAERARYFGASQNPAIASGWGHIVLLFNEYFRR